MAIVLTAAVVLAQGKDFTGKWTVDAEKTAAAMPAGAPAGGGGGGRGGGGGGGDMTIAMDAKTLTITRTTPAGETKTVYNLDGTDSKNQQAGRGGAAPTDVISNAKWDGAALAVTTKGANGDTVAKYSMDGASLKIETTRPGRQGGAATTTAVFYKKAA
jgi:hypothetical protein